MQTEGDPRAELDQFLGLIVHDLKTDLRGLREIPGWIEEDCAREGVTLPVEVSDNLTLLKNSAGRLSHRLERLIEFFRAGQASDAPRMEKLGEQIELAWRSMDLPKGFTLNILPPDCEYLANVVDIQALWKELLHNAVSHSGKDSGTITVSSRRQGQGLVVQIADDGVGIASAHREDVFKPFYSLQCDNSGAGLGLTIARRIAEAAGGTLKLSEPQISSGCLAVVEIPAAQAAEAA